jgi:hypothetical protein
LANRFADAEESIQRGRVGRRRQLIYFSCQELVRRAEARTVAASLFQPTHDKKGEFFIESPQKIFAHLLLELPSPH